MDCSGDSSNGGHEDCTEVHSGRGMQWNDLDCIQTRPYVCGYSRSVGAPSMDLEVKDCDGNAITTTRGQIVAFGCISHEVTNCGYNTNNDAGNYAAALAAFYACTAASSDYGCNLQLTVAEGLSMQDSCPGGNYNDPGIGFHTVIPFTTICADTYHFRFHADYGKGGYYGVNDGTAGSHDGSDIWGLVQVNDVALDAGDHYFEALGFEGCCDGHSELDVMIPGSTGGFSPYPDTLWMPCVGFSLSLCVYIPFMY
jgi:hypothetical protein